MLKIISGNGKYKYTRKIQTEPIIRPTNAAQGICLKGFKNNDKPVIINKYLVAVSQTSADQIAAPVSNNKIPTKNPKIEITFSIMLIGFPTIGADFSNIANNQAAAAIPPKINIIGV